MPIQVYHAKNPTFHVPKNFTRGSVESFVRDFHHVASVECETLDTAYMLTNSIFGPWWVGPDVTFHGSPDHGKEGCRSTSVGDILIMPEGDAFVAYVVDSIGYRKLED
jgi:hypothetical protein